jgi:hypothetical protein
MTALLGGPGIALAIDGDYTQVISNQLAPVLQTCVKHIESKMEGLKGKDSFTFKVLPNGKAKDFIYKTENRMPEKWLQCARNAITAHTFERPPDKQVYVHNGTMTWNMSPDDINPAVDDKDREAIYQVLRDNSAQFEQCYKEYLEQGGKKEGNIVLQWDLTTEGKAIKAHLNINEIGDRGFMKCVLGTLKGLPFPKQEKEIQSISYPIYFKKQQP